MSWISAFTDELGKLNPHEPRWVLESIPSIPAYHPQLGGTLAISSHQEGSTHVQAIGRRCSIRGASVNPWDWSTSPGTMRIELTPRIIRSVVDARLIAPRGSVVALRMSFGAWSGAWQDLFVGVVTNYTFSGGRWFLHARDLTYGLTSRFTRSTANYGLANDLTSTTVASIYTAGDPTLEVASTSGFRTNAAGDYILKVDPASGDPFYLLATGTGTSPTKFTGVSGTGQFGTTAVDAAGSPSTSDVTEVMHVSAHPIRAAQQVLTSTGTLVANGPHDVLPKTWGYGMPESMVSDVDASYWVGESSVSGSDSWDLVVDEEATNPYGTLRSWLAAGGYYLTMWQGQITARCGVVPFSGVNPGWSRIDWADVESLSYDAYAPSFAAEYESYRVNDLDGAQLGTPHSEAPIDHRPAIKQHIQALPDVHSNGTAIADGVSARLGPWKTRVPERMTLKLRGWRNAVSSAGDVGVAYLFGGPVFSRRAIAGESGFAGGHVLFGQVSPNWFGGPSVDCTIYYLPELAAEQ